MWSSPEVGVSQRDAHEPLGAPSVGDAFWKSSSNVVISVMVDLPASCTGYIVTELLLVISPTAVGFSMSQGADRVTHSLM